MILGIVDRGLAQPGVNIIPGPDGRPILGSSMCSRNYSNGQGWVPIAPEDELECSYCGRPADHSKTQQIDGSYLARCTDCAPDLTAGLPRRPTKFGGSGDHNEIMEYIPGLAPKPYMQHNPEKESVMQLTFGAPGLLLKH